MGWTGLYIPRYMAFFPMSITYQIVCSPLQEFNYLKFYVIGNTIFDFCGIAHMKVGLLKIYIHLWWKFSRIKPRAVWNCEWFYLVQITKCKILSKIISMIPRSIHNSNLCRTWESHYIPIIIISSMGVLMNFFLILWWVFPIIYFSKLILIMFN